MYREARAFWKLCAARNRMVKEHNTATAAELVSESLASSPWIQTTLPHIRPLPSNAEFPRYCTHAFPSEQPRTSYIPAKP